MHFLKKFDLTIPQLLKLAALALGALIVLALFVHIIGKSFGLQLGNVAPHGVYTKSVPGHAPSYYETEEAYEDMALSVRNVVSSDSMPAPYPTPGYSMGSDAEAFEVKEYAAQIETRDLERDCEIVRALKARDAVIFEHANEYERGCRYTFKVAHEEVAEVLTIIERLDPQELTEHAYTIKRVVDDYTSEVEILERKLASIDATLEDAIMQYDSITGLATRVQDVESLAKIIDSKITIIERLTQERIRANAELERINRAKEEQLDRLNYTYFTVSLHENKFVDGEALKRSWKAAVQTFVHDVNTTLQDLSVGLITLLLLLVQYALYFFILLFVVRFGWDLTKKIWMK